jgi:uncharacterized protein YnzC (UPF0291/DUF896 family)
MSETNTPVTEADILGQIVGPDRADLPPELARLILNLKFNHAALDRMDELAEKNSQGILSEAEREEMERYMRVGSFLDLMQAKARVSLRNLDCTE